jgi:hypothetical protein
MTKAAAHMPTSFRVLEAMFRCYGGLSSAAVHEWTASPGLVSCSEQIPTPICGFINVMTASQLLDARMLIPGAYELNAPPHRSGRVAPVAPATASDDLSSRAATASAAHVVAAPARPTTPLAQAGAVVGDIALLLGIIYGVAVVPALVLWGITAAAALVVGN